MLIGIVIQMGESPEIIETQKLCSANLSPYRATVAITCYVILASEFFFRFFAKRPLRPCVIPWPSDDNFGKRSELRPKIRFMMLGLGLSAVCLFIR